MNANVESENSSSGFDKVKWLVVIAILASSVVANTMFQEVSIAIRATLFVVAVAISAGIGMQTEKGRQFVGFAKESRIEVRKVVWPSHTEARHTTLIIAAATVIMSLLLALIDFALLQAVGQLTGLEF